VGNKFFLGQGAGTDVNVFISGSSGGKTRGEGVAVFGGDLVISGVLRPDGELRFRENFGKMLFGEVNNDIFFRSVDGNTLTINAPSITWSLNDAAGDKKDSDAFNIYKGGQGIFQIGKDGFQWNPAGIIKGTTGSFSVRTPESTSIYATGSQVLIHSGGGGESPNEINYTDTNFFVSGSVGSKGGQHSGTAVFGGDMVVSGAVYQVHSLNKIPPESGYGDIVTIGNSVTTPGKLYYYSNTGWSQTGAKGLSHGSSQLLGIALGPHSTNGMLVRGFANISVDNQGANDEGKSIYLSTVSGNVTGSAPSSSGEFVRLLGWIADDNGIVYFSPSNDWLELT